MILIVSGLIDGSGPLWKKAFPKGAAFIVNPLDFSRGGTAIYPDCEGDSRIRSGRSVVRLSEVTGVLTLTQAFLPEEFVQFDQDTRAYAAAEANALLSHILHSLRCRKINAPSHSGLGGPFRYHEQWYRMAMRVGVPCPPHVTRNGHSKDSYTLPADSVNLICLDGSVINEAPQHLTDYALKLQSESGLNYLSVRFSRNHSGEYFFSHAAQVPDAKDREVREAVVRYLRP